MAGDRSKRRSTRQADGRKRSLYVEPDTDDDFAISEHDEEAREAFEPEAAPVTKKAKTSSKGSGRPPQRGTRSKASNKTGHRQSPFKSSAPRKSKHISKPTKDILALPTIPSDGIIPKWRSLPYDILLQVFSFAFAAELDIEKDTVANRRTNHPNTWIMRTARRTCHEFAEPALTAFYQSPNLLANRWLEDLNALVKQPQESVAFKYKMKVKSLKISSLHLESQRKENNSLLPELVSQLPQLDELTITHPMDGPPFEMAGRPPKWRYQEELFDTLDRTNIRLSEWRWNWHLSAETVTGQPWYEPSFGELLKGIHARTSFQSLQHLTISHLPCIPPFPELIENEEDPAGVSLAVAICSLPNLKSLKFESCDCLTSQLLQNLPRNLEKLEITNCATLTSDLLYNFLSRNEFSNIKELILDHNPFLDLAFLTSLRTLCPKLQVLKMDLYDHRENYFRHFGEPKYEQLLLEDEIPTWPSTLRSLELVHLQKWGAGSAQNLFRSLVESAASLPDLRRLVLQAHINISWRDRAAFRDQWIERLQRVCLRQNTEPDRNLASFKAWRMWKESQQPKPPAPDNENRRSLSHIRITPRKASSTTPDEEHNSDSEALSKRRSKRISDQQVILAATPPQQPEPVQPKGKGRRRRGRRVSDAISVTSNANAESTEEDWRNTPEKFIQGLCNVVDIRIDNQRPREEQLNESHFLDSEASGDEEWTEGAEADDEHYAW